MKTLVIYKGKYGAIEQYAEWIGEELNAQVLTPGNCSQEQLADAELVIIGTSIYIGTMVIKEWIKENLSILLSKKLVLFAVCGTPADEKEKLDSYLKTSVPEELREKIHTYFLPGKPNYKKLSFLEKFLLKAGSLLPGNAGRSKSRMDDYNDVKKQNIGTMIKDIKAIIFRKKQEGYNIIQYN